MCFINPDEVVYALHCFAVTWVLDKGLDKKNTRLLDLGHTDDRGLRVKLLKWRRLLFRNYLSDQQQLTITESVPQGLVLGPLIFAIY